MNELIIKLNTKLKKFNIQCAVKKETVTQLKCYLFDINDCIIISENIKNYCNCKKLDTIYKKSDLYIIVNDKKSLESFCKKEAKNYNMAKKLNLLRK